MELQTIHRASASLWWLVGILQPALIAGKMGESNNRNLEVIADAKNEIKLCVAMDINSHAFVEKSRDRIHWM